MLSPSPNTTGQNMLGVRRFHLENIYNSLLELQIKSDDNMVAV